MTLADHPMPDLITELDLPVKNPDLVATFARGELDARRRREETTKWTIDRIGGWIVARELVDQPCYDANQSNDQGL